MTVFYIKYSQNRLGPLSEYQQQFQRKQPLGDVVSDHQLVEDAKVVRSLFIENFKNDSKKISFSVIDVLIRFYH